MSENGHDLHAEFPQHRAVLHDLKVENASFRELSARYHEIAQEISRIEAGIEPASDQRLEDLKKHRLQMLDQVSAMIAEKQAA
ncbi:hypothetical protein L288_11230 [Sphingobium quisquiliarum P25]|uniref:GTP-binding protein n=1 Tax=Sphingobium quisquiliarum P25 TaxID=1329909 RepID=T0GRB1_9SPHN|nr:DUF465 domain-containing protein [Sphingobium quisquiliarum]EQB06416.1 hypothetical protein L288_11230 [Sphingobium quisquiliarum P25]